VSDAAPTTKAPMRSFVERIRHERRNGFPSRRAPQDRKPDAERPAGDPNAPTSEAPPHDFAERVRRERGNNMFLVRGNDSTGRAAWYFVLVDSAKKTAFRKAFTGQVELNAYGRIIASGYGADPPTGVRDRMKAEYGFTGE
jgi:hypothetical protein